MRILARRWIYLITVICLILQNQLLLASTLQLQCGEDGTLISHQAEWAANEVSLKRRLSANFQLVQSLSDSSSCPLQKKLSSHPSDVYGDVLLIPDPNSSKQNLYGANYSVPAMKRIIDDAIKWGVDPYLALAIEIHENPPEINKVNYSLGFVVHPPAVFDEMGCTTSPKQTTYANSKPAKEFNLAPQLPENEVDHVSACIPNEKKSTWKALYNMEPISLMNQPDTSGCCAKLIIPKNIENAFGETKDGKLSHLNPISKLFKSYLAAQILKNKVINHFDGSSRPLDIASAIQFWNGTKADHGNVNKDMIGFDMGKCPQYGAEIGDIMANMLMNNLEVKELIKDEIDANGSLPQKSLFCQNHIGPVQINGEGFTDLEKQFNPSNKSCF